MVGDMVALLDHMKSKKAVFAAGDIGGIVAQKLAFLKPRKCCGLVIINTPILGATMHLIHHDQEQQEISHFLLKFIQHNPSDKYDLDYVVRTIPDPAYCAEIKAYPQQSPEWGMLYFFGKNYPGPPYGQDIDTSGMHYFMPCCIIWGMKEPYLSDKILDSFYKWFD